MASLGITPAREAIEDCMQGLVGDSRAIDRGVFAKGVFDGQPIQSKQALSINTSEGRHRFDVVFSRWRESGASSISSTGDSWIAECDVAIQVFTHTASVAQRDERDDLADQLLTDLRNAKQALETPGNLSQTALGKPTTIISGLIDELTFGVDREDWDNSLLYSSITGLLRLDVSND